jgi:hypothetical protein
MASSAIFGVIKIAPALVPIMIPPREAYSRSYQMVRYIGVRIAGRLAAMAGVLFFME